MRKNYTIIDCSNNGDYMVRGGHDCTAAVSESLRIIYVVFGLNCNRIALARADVLYSLQD